VLILVAGSPPEPDRPDPAVLYRPDLVGADPETTGAALAAVVPDVFVSAGTVPPAALAGWRAAAPQAVLLVVTGTRPVAAGFARHGVAWRLVPDLADSPADSLAGPLAVAERAWNEVVAEALLSARVPAPAARAARSVTLVGGGVVNLVTALQLARAGYAVSVYDGAPDPRAGAPWTAYGCTRGGGDGRMFTLTEADSYNDRAVGPRGTPNGLLERTVRERGWLVADPAGLAPRERQWAADFQRMPAWLARGFTADIFAFNQAAAGLWQRFMAADPELFDAAATGYQDGILRLYSEAAYFRWHIARNEGVGAVRRVLTPTQVAADYPALADAVGGGELAGGIEVTGFTVNIHRFLARLVSVLEEAGVRFHWEQRVRAVRRTAGGTVTGVETPGGLVRSQHYVLSPGAYGRDLLAGTAAAGEIQGMLGVWLTVPNIEPRLAHSLKMARAGHRAEETNVTLGVGDGGEPVLICGSGYGWTGLDPGNVDQEQVEELYLALEDTVRRLFPAAHAAAVRGGALAASRRLCVRPWTASCLGVFEQLPTADGGVLVVTGGHNTGGFAQAPVVAEAVRDALAGRRHPMHLRYDPARLRRYYDLTARAPSPA
jgi:glycine/D-amino acid oxidase-like deaminating enzyme